MKSLIPSWRDSLSLTFAGTRHQFLGTQCTPEHFSVCLSELVTLSGSGHAGDGVLRLFVAVSDQRQLNEINGQLASDFATLVSRTEVVIQPPLLGQVQISAWRIEPSSTTSKVSESKTNGLEWHFSASNLYDVSDTHLLTSYTRQFYGCLADSKERGHSVDDLLRTWIYIGSITHGPHDETRYQIVNAARKDVFRELRLGAGEGKSRFPASTGIGTQGSSINLGFLSCRINATNEYRAVALENRRQTSAFHYPKEESLVAPLFSRAVAILGAAEAMVFVSGTASIIGVKSIHLSSIEQQTRQTIDNISNLLCARLLSDYDSYPVTTGLDSIVCYTVYLKHRDDFAAVRDICESRLPERAIATYVEADVCRSELLVEIEATAVMPG
ncbi:Rid family hydrolase [Pseudomonas sp. KFB-139]|uniref:Rid family hydrolase n=1 Tax=Pseudomonas serbiensis TaxID=3064350 RepID=A0ABT9CMW7_9PSED|nr:Rid family hydrolase [Pseudomonas sp. KFB-138]MDO7926847.1 Rid family hydrolase [Pseudomonas sp. KFB-138]